MKGLSLKIPNIVWVVILFSCQSGPAPIKPTLRDITESVYASGVIKASGQYDVYSSTTGILHEVLITEGDTVKTGTPLFKIDNTVSEIAAHNAAIALEQSKRKSSQSSSLLLDMEARLRLAKDKLSNDSLLLVRQKTLWDSQVGSKQDLEKRELAFQSSTTEYESLKLQYKQLKNDLDDAYLQAQNNYKISLKQQSDYIIKSSLDGIIFSVLRDPGELITPQLPLAVIGSSNQYEMELQIDEYDIAKIKPGLPVFVTMDSYKGQLFEGIITRFEPIMNERTRTIMAYATFIKQPERLIPNLTLEANILIRTKKNALTIPASYLINENKVLTAPNETTAVKIGISDLNYAEITDGISAGTTIYLPKK
ncbi:MAG TPA: efflux RND transporter periplasmic adaptor subunit [Bacteroidia bacterium]|nr:efflux RND transporter periplasmic adaptor subunit [Bacteroidia bacterium]